MQIVNKIFRVTVLAYLLLPSICARTDENVETVNNLIIRWRHSLFISGHSRSSAYGIVQDIQLDPVTLIQQANLVTR